MSAFGSLRVTDSSASQVLSVDPATGVSTAVASIPSPTGIDADASHLFVGSFNGGVYRLDPADPGGSMTNVLSVPGGGIFDVAYGNGS